MNTETNTARLADCCPPETALRVLVILGDLLEQEPGQTLLNAWAKAWDQILKEHYYGR